MFVKGELFEFLKGFFLVDKAEQYRRIRNNDGYLPDPPFDTPRLFLNKRALVLTAAIQQVMPAIPDKLFCVFGNIFRDYACFLEGGGDLPRCCSLSGSGAAEEIYDYCLYRASLLSRFFSFFICRYSFQSFPLGGVKSWISYPLFSYFSFMRSAALRPH